MIGSGDEFAMIFPAIVSRTVSYSPECVEVEFCELRLYGVLGSSRVCSAPLALFVSLHAPVCRRLEVGREPGVLVSGPCLFQLLLGEDCSREVYAPEVRSLEVRSLEVRSLEVHSLEVRSLEVRFHKARPA